MRCSCKHRFPRLANRHAVHDTELQIRRQEEEGVSGLKAALLYVAPADSTFPA